MNLSNLKLGQTKVAGDVAVTKTDGGYEISQSGIAAGTLTYDKADKVWILTSDGAIEYVTATAKTVVDEVVALWAIKFQAHQEAEAGEPEGAINVVDEIIAEDGDENDTLDYEVSTQGGHTAHRASALGAIAAAMGGEVAFSQADGPGYRGQAMIHVLAPRETIKAINETLDEMVEIMEAQAAKISRDVSSAARAAGKHHSIHGCHARRGFLAGFGLGVARQIAGDEFEAPEIVTLQAFTQEHYEAGLAFGGSRVL